MTEELVALCDSYERSAWVKGTDSKPIEIKSGDHFVPTDFWRLEHAYDHQEPYWIPTGGSWARWSQSVFTTEIALSCWHVGERYPEFGEVWEYGSAPAEITITVHEVSFSSIELQRLCERRNIPAIVRQAERKTFVQQGRKSDQLAIYARFAADLMDEKTLEAYADNVDDIVAALMQSATSASEDQAFKDSTIRKFAELVQREAYDRLAELNSMNGPPS